MRGLINLGGHDNGWVSGVEPIHPAPDLVCLWAEDERGLCEQPAEYVRTDTYVEEQLCERHMLEENAALDAGFGAILRDFGLQDAVDYIPLAEPASVCDVAECRERATYGERITESLPVCPNHVPDRTD